MYRLFYRFPMIKLLFESTSLKFIILMKVCRGHVNPLKTIIETSTRFSCRFLKIDSELPWWRFGLTASIRFQE